MNFEAIYVIVYGEELYSLLYRISYKKVNEYSDILGRNCCAFYVTSVIQNNISKKYFLLSWAEHLYY